MSKLRLKAVAAVSVRSSKHPATMPRQGMVAFYLEDLMDTNSLGFVKLSVLADIVSMMRPPEVEGEYIISLCSDNALMVAENCLSIMSETECDEVIDYWEKVCAYIKLRSVRH